jgi:hypothetical protein
MVERRRHRRRAGQPVRLELSAAHAIAGDGGGGAGDQLEALDRGARLAELAAAHLPNSATSSELVALTGRRGAAEEPKPHRAPARRRSRRQPRGLDRARRRWRGRGARGAPVVAVLALDHG